MNFLYGITILLVYQLVGEVAVLLLSVPVPGPVVGMALLFLTLLFRGRLSRSLDTTSAGLMSHLSLLFIPAAVGIVVHFDRISSEWLPITVALVLSTVVSMVATAGIMSGTSLLCRSKECQSKEH